VGVRGIRVDVVGCGTGIEASERGIDWDLESIEVDSCSELAAAEENREMIEEAGGIAADDNIEEAVDGTSLEADCVIVCVTVCAP
jgi:hypothetical protein